jgi:putative ABC transport system permease protein
MIKNYLIIALRNLKKTKLFSTINILGLSIGMASCLLILHYVNFEKSYDAFHDNADRIYRIRIERTSEDGSAVRFASCCPPAGGLIRERYPQAERVARIFHYRAVISHENIKFTEEKIYFAETEFFQIFKFKSLAGQPLDSLKEPNKAFISQSCADKYFADQNALGKIINIDRRADYQIVGVFEDIPKNSHIKFDIILPFQNLRQLHGPEYMEAWGHTGMYTYVLLKTGADPKLFENKLKDLVESEFGEVLRQYNMVMELKLQPLKDIHLTSNFMQEYEVNGNLQTVNFLSIIALFIVIIAWVNYINLSTAQSLSRAKEVGLRKVVGASRKQISIQFFYETIILNLISILVALLIIKVSLPHFIQITGTSMAFSIWTQDWFWIAVLFMLFGGTFISGLYPVLAMSSFQPMTVLRGKPGTSGKGINLRKVLVISQFVLALLLITGTLALSRQIDFMKNQNLGFSIDQILVIKAPRIRDESFGEKIVTFKNTLLKNSNINKFCVVTEVPGRQIYWDNGGIMRAGEDISKSKNYQIVGIDYDFIDVFDIQMLVGRNFSKEFVADKEALLFNETATAWMGFENSKAAVGQKVNYWGNIYTIIGVIKDYHQQSLKETFEPHIYRLMPQGRGTMALFALKINAENTREILHQIKRQYNDFFPGNPFDYFFLDEYFNRQYKSDELLQRIFGLFSSLALFITALGILGLTAFMTTQRTKEIGIRKVVGAGVKQILLLLSKDFLKLIIISFIIALPFLLWGVNEWLNSFAKRMEISSMLFLIPLLLVILVTLITIATHVIRAAFANPVDALRYE